MAAAAAAAASLVLKLMTAAAAAAVVPAPAQLVCLLPDLILLPGPLAPAPAPAPAPALLVREMCADLRHSGEHSDLNLSLKRLGHSGEHSGANMITNDGPSLYPCGPSCKDSQGTPTRGSAGMLPTYGWVMGPHPRPHCPQVMLIYRGSGCVGKKEEITKKKVGNQKYRMSSCSRCAGLTCFAKRSYVERKSGDIDKRKKLLWCSVFTFSVRFIWDTSCCALTSGGGSCSTPEASKAN